MKNFTDLEREFLDEKSFGDLLDIGFDIAMGGPMGAFAHGDAGLRSLSILKNAFADEDMVDHLISYLQEHIENEPLSGAEIEDLLKEAPFEYKEFIGNDYGLACGYIVGKDCKDADE